MAMVSKGSDSQTNINRSHSRCNVVFSFVYARIGQMPRVMMIPQIQAEVTEMTVKNDFGNIEMLSAAVLPIVGGL